MPVPRGMHVVAVLKHYDIPPPGKIDTENHVKPLRMRDHEVGKHIYTGTALELLRLRMHAVIRKPAALRCLRFGDFASIVSFSRERHTCLLFHLVGTVVFVLIGGVACVEFSVQYLPGTFDTSYVSFVLPR